MYTSMWLREKVCESTVIESFHNKAMSPLLRILEIASMELKPISFFIGSISSINGFISMRNKTVDPFDCILKIYKVVKVSSAYSENKY